MKLRIVITARIVDVMIVSKNDCHRSLFCVVYNPVSTILCKHIRTMSNRTVLFSEYKIVHKLPDVAFGGEVLKNYLKEKDRLLGICNNADEYRAAVHRLLDEYRTKYSF